MHLFPRSRARTLLRALAVEIAIAICTCIYFDTAHVTSSRDADADADADAVADTAAARAANGKGMDAPGMNGAVYVTPDEASCRADCCGSPSCTGFVWVNKLPFALQQWVRTEGLRLQLHEYCACITTFRSFFAFACIARKSPFVSRPHRMCAEAALTFARPR